MLRNTLQSWHFLLAQRKQGSGEYGGNYSDYLEEIKKSISLTEPRRHASFSAALCLQTAAGCEVTGGQGVPGARFSRGLHLAAFPMGFA